MSKAKYVYIPGTKIPSMTAKHGEAVQAAGKRARTSGLSNVQRNLNLAMKKGIGKSVTADSAVSMSAVLHAAEQGTIEGLAILDEDMKKTPPTIPLDTGNLRSSWFIEPMTGKAKGYAFAVLAGFGANYAVYVHEMTDEAYGKEINWSEPGSGPKFLEYGLKRNSKIIVGKVVSRVQAVTLTG